MNRHHKLANYNIATEVIDFQRDGFGKQLEVVFADMIQFIEKHKNSQDIPLSDDGETYQSGGLGNLIMSTRLNIGQIKYLRQIVADSHFKKILADLVEKRFGFKTKFTFNTNVPAAVMPYFGLNKNILTQGKSSITQLLLGLYGKEQDEILRQSDKKTGSVDLKHAKVSGIFTKYTHEIYFDIVVNHLVKKLTPAEMTGVIMHEIGHIFTFYEFSDRCESTNQVLANLSRKTHSMTLEQERDYVLSELGSILNFSNSEIKEIKEEKDLKASGLLLVKKLINHLLSQTPESKYNNTASEQLADNFAARFGYGREVITGLDKVMPGFINFHRNETMFAIGMILSAYFGIYSSVKNLINCAKSLQVLNTMSPFGIFMLCYSVYSNTNALLGRGDAMRDMTYDDLKSRYKRLRDQSIEMIKELDLSKDELRNVVDRIHQMDEIIKHTFDNHAWATMFANFVFPKSRAVHKDIEMQKLLETLAHNDLFLKSAEFRTL